MKKKIKVVEGGIRRRIIRLWQKIKTWIIKGYG